MTNTEIANASKIMLGTTEAIKMYIGSTLIWEALTTLPYDAEIEYLEGTGTQWIDTLIHPETGYGFELYGGFTTFNNNEFFGGGNRWDNGLGICTHGAGTYGIIVGTNEVCTISAQNNVMHLFRVNTDGTVYVDNEYKGQSTSPQMPSGNYTMNIFRHSATAVPRQAKIYYCKIFNSNGLVFDGIPVRKNGVGYMYDKVSGLLYGNNGTGSFTLGPDIVEIEYLESTGTLCIDTGIYPNTTCDFCIDVSVKNDTDKDSCIFSAATDWRFGLLGEFVAELKFYYLLGELAASASFDTDRHFFNVKNGNLYLDSVLRHNILLQQQNIQTTLKLLSHGNKTLYLKGKLYGFTYTDQNVNMNLVPVRVGQVGYMYDKVTGRLFGNSGTGSFILGRDKLPTGYTELEYISSSSGGNQYIDLGIKLYETLNTNYDIAMKFNIASGNTNQAAVFACQDSDNDPWPGTFVRVNSSSGKVIGRYIGGTAKDNTLGNIGANIELPVQTSPNKNVTSLNNNNSTHQYGTSLFCAFVGGINTPARYCNAKLYYFKLFVGGTLVRDLIPCKNSSNVVGMYDVVNNIFYTSPNGNAFVAGPAV